MERLILPLCALCLLFSACAKDVENEPKRKFFSLRLLNEILLGENPKAVFTPAVLDDLATDNDYNRITITGTATSGEVLSFMLTPDFDSLTTGTYHSGEGNAMSIYYPATKTALVAGDGIGSLTMEVINVNDSLFEAKFEAQLIDTTGAIAPKTATDGFIRAIVSYPR
jgi:hypothetical protein